MNTEITYRRGFAGFLCAVDESLRRSPGGGTLPPIRSLEGSEGLFDEAQLVDTDRARAREFWNRLRRVSAPAAQTCFAAFCSDRRDKDGALFRGIARILGEGPRALEDLGDKDIAEVLAASRRTLGEAHKFCGLLRFRELADSSWYAAIKPDCDILPFIGEHFSNRFRIMRFIIHDPGRSAAILHQPGKPWRLVQGFSIREEGGGESPSPYRDGNGKFAKAGFGISKAQPWSRGATSGSRRAICLKSTGTSFPKLRTPGQNCPYSCCPGSS